MQSYERRGCPINYYKMGRVKEKAIIVTKKYEIRFIIMNFLNKQGWDVLVEKCMFPEYGKLDIVRKLVGKDKMNIVQDQGSGVKQAPDLFVYKDEREYFFVEVKKDPEPQLGSRTSNSFTSS